MTTSAISATRSSTPCDELDRAGPGDVLVFLPGEREIREAAEALRKHHPPHTEILPLFARLSSEEQGRIFRPHLGRRIVLATNVAETSLTVPGIRYVVDSGLARIKRYSYRNKGRATADRENLAGLGQSTRRALWAGRGRSVHPPLRRAGFLRSARRIRNRRFSVRRWPG